MFDHIDISIFSTIYRIISMNHKVCVFRFVCPLPHCQSKSSMLVNEQCCINICYPEKIDKKVQNLRTSLPLLVKQSFYLPVPT